MHVGASPLERWFTLRPGPYRHMLGGAAVEAWPHVALQEMVGPLEFDLDWGYDTPQGCDSLRALIAEDEGLPAEDGVLLTQGASEGNFLALAALLSPGDRVIMQWPIYPQLRALAQAWGAQVHLWRPSDGHSSWEVDTLLDGVDSSVRLVVLNSPHNPTGHCLEPSDLARVVEAVRGTTRGHLLLDEVYRGLAPSPGSTLRRLGPARLLVTNSVSKAWGLPGARVGWLAGDSSVLADAVLWREHNGLALSNTATAWVRHIWPHKDRLMAANQAILARNRAMVEAWLAERPDLRGGLSPHAGVCLLGIHAALPFDDQTFAEACYRDDRVLVIPGGTIGMPGVLRVGIGQRDATVLKGGLDYLDARLSAWSRTGAP
ncbi:MAG: pyridoxal phosphate-dependent aminotransferase [Candidatus Sericytochromatia bacterium]|nr:pyridoxal phosphate-dependent aminotransferase [Candidatus Sericytochromatia bacterium]